LKNWLIAIGIILLSLFLAWLFNIFPTLHTNSTATRKRYGKRIIYYDFSKIPNNFVLTEKTKLPKDLKKFLDDEFNNPRIKNPSRFEKEVQEEAANLGFSLDELKRAGFREVITAAVKIVASRLDYYPVDLDKSFIKKYGEYRSADFYFHLKLGDCDKYRDAVIAIFNLVKKSNKRLKNVYLSREKLGGNPDNRHAWVSILIPQKNYLILSHIDPTFYDADNNHLEASSFHICLERNIFIAYFYKELEGCDNLLYSYQILTRAFFKTKDKKGQERLLNEMSFIVLLISIYKPRIAADEISWLVEEYEAVGLKKNLDSLFYRAYAIYSRAEETLKAEKYKKRLYKEFPNCYWVKKIEG